MRRVLVTGGGGFIGRQALPLLRERGFEVHAVGRHPPSDPAVSFHQADLLDIREATRAVRAARASHLLHLAWCAEPGLFWTSPTNLDWLGASLAVLRAFAEAGGQRALLAGTCAEYEWGKDDRLDEERTPLAPVTLYGVTKDALRRVAMEYAETGALSVAWGQIFFLYGPGEKRGRLVSDAVHALRFGQPFVTSEGSQRRDFMHIEDAAGAFSALLASDVRGAVNIGSGRAVPVRSILEEIAREIGGQDLLQFGARPMPPNEPPVIEAAVDRLRSQVGFTPRYSLRDGLAQTVHWWREQSQ